MCVYVELCMHVCMYVSMYVQIASLHRHACVRV